MISNKNSSNFANRSLIFNFDLKNLDFNKLKTN